LVQNINYTSITIFQSFFCDFPFIARSGKSHVTINLIGLEQGWANSGPRAKCGPPLRFQWPAEAFRKYVQI